MIKKTYLMMAFITLSFHASLSYTQENFPEFKGEYLGQKPPGKTPEIFAPGIISTEKGEGGVAFGLNGKLFIFQKYENRKSYTYEMILKNGKWSDPVLLPFSEKFMLWDFSIAPDGETMIFSSNIRIEELKTDGEEGCIWTARRTENGWTSPEYLKSPVNTRWHDSFPSLAGNMNLYFFSRRPGGKGLSDLYMSKFENGTYSVIENLGEPFNTKYHEWDPFIAPDESYLIFCSKKSGGFGEDDFYISFRSEHGSWTKPVNMGNKINSPKSDNRPYVSPDGKFFFYTSDKSGSRDVYWVSTEIFKNYR
jgi:hypothetical protein